MSTCDKLILRTAGGGGFYCNREKGHEANCANTSGWIPMPGPQQTITSLRELRESLAALVTEFRGLREDQQRLNGLLLERLTNIDQKFSGVYGGQDALAVAFNRNTGDLGESAMRNHTQMMDALDRYFGEMKKLYGKLNYNVEQRRGKRRK